MKRIVLTLLCATAVLSCSGDLGNYDYKDLAEPAVTGIESRYERLNQERLVISPTISGGLSEDEYDYEWKVIDNNGDNEVTVIGTEKDLDYVVILSPGEYSLFYTLTGKESGTYWRTASTLSVSSSMSEGWMVLCSEPDGRARLDFVSAVTEKTYFDVLKDNAGMPAYHGPRRIHWQAAMTFTEAPYYLFTDEGATRLGKNAFEWKENYRIKYEMATMMDAAPSVMVSAGFGKLIVNGTDAYYSENISIQGLYGSPVNKGYRVAPYIGANVSAEQYAAIYLLYDIDNRKFMAYCPFIEKNEFGNLNPVAGMDEMGQIANGFAGEGHESVVGTAFDVYPEGYDLRYMENTLYDPGNAYMGVTYSILAKDGECWIYGIQLGDMLLYSDCTFMLGKACRVDISGCRDILADGVMYAFSSLKNYMYYAVGDTVYGVDLTATEPTGKVLFQLPGETITMMKFNLYRQKANSRRSYDLVVGSEKDGKGTLRIYEGYESDGDFSKVTPEKHEGFGKIVDATYKERTY